MFSVMKVLESLLTCEKCEVFYCHSIRYSLQSAVK